MPVLDRKFVRKLHKASGAFYVNGDARQDIIFPWNTYLFYFLN